MGSEGRGRKFRGRQKRGAQGRIPDSEAMEPGFKRQVENAAEEVIESEGKLRLREELYMFKVQRE